MVMSWNRVYVPADVGAAVGAPVGADVGGFVVTPTVGAAVGAPVGAAVSGLAVVGGTAVGGLAVVGGDAVVGGVMVQHVEGPAHALHADTVPPAQQLPTQGMATCAAASYTYFELLQLPVLAFTSQGPR